MANPIVDRLRRPEYTGENRCNLCTQSNLLIAAGLSWLIARKSNLSGFLVALGSIALIYLRGYLFPRTPTLTKQYFPTTVIQLFGGDEPTHAGGLEMRRDAPTGEASGMLPIDDPDSNRNLVDAPEPTAAETKKSNRSNDASRDSINFERSSETVDLETYFLSHELAKHCSNRNDICLSDEFEGVWVDEMKQLADAEPDIGTAINAFGFDGNKATFELVIRNGGYILRSNASQIGTWPSHAALIADIAASRILESWVADWESYDPQDKGQILNGLRMLLRQCPSGGDVRMTEEAVESCCHPYTVVALVCRETGERLFEQPVDK